MPRYKLFYSAEALQEIRLIISWYNQISSGLGEKFKKNLLVEISKIKKTPQTRSFRYDEVKFAVVKAFPYAAHYTVDQDNSSIKIQAVLGFSQDSESNWRIRF